MSAANSGEGMTEAHRSDCFLCSPKDDLVFHRSSAGVALAGLGPVTPGYSVVAAPQHVRFLAELASPLLTAYLTYVERVRAFLVRRYGSCLITEHGNTALCAEYVADHPFHPHVLMFPSAASITSIAVEYFRDYEQATSLSDVVRIAGERQYMLVSPNDTEYFVFFPKDGMPRQFARGLVAEQSGQIELASWRNHPNLDLALKYAALHRDTAESEI